MRNITQLARLSDGVMVLIETTIEVQGGSDGHQQQDAAESKRTRAGFELDSAFSGPSGEKLMLTCGGETSSQIVDTACDCLVLVHDGFGRVKQEKARSDSRRMIVEVAKDRIGGTTGLWAIWTSDGQS
jgi:hypothetical protein